jgi:hypothetical protein
MKEHGKNSWALTIEMKSVIGKYYSIQSPL